MGAVTIQTCNWQLMITADYEDAKRVKHLLRNFSNLEQLAGMGDSVAASIFIDLKAALNSRYLTTTQMRYLDEYFLRGLTLKEIAMFDLRSISSVQDAIDRGVRNIQKALLEGKLFEQERIGKGG